ncbi:MAG TPA: 2-oxo-tetronate isomerase [Stellaceae bacterium]|jgi:hydroxypyruvate isomerase|nr:2-oxo-tetronate isomerase [Stellaceae bacterium]
MLQFAANLTLMYPEHDFLERFAAAARDGFTAVEYVSPYEYTPAELKARLDVAGSRQVLFNAAIGDWNAGERGLASLPGRKDDFRRAIDRALDYAGVLGNKLIHVMAGLVPAGAERQSHVATYLENLAHAAAAARSAGITLVIEPINTRDMPGYFLNTQEAAATACRQIGAPNLKVLFDCYHCQIVEGDVTKRLEKHFADIGHIQIAGVPARTEPDTGELHYPFVFETLERLGYEGWIGAEYRPKAGTSAGLGWLKPYLR